MIELLTPFAAPLGIVGLALTTAGQALIRRWPPAKLKSSAAVFVPVEPTLPARTPAPAVVTAQANDEWIDDAVKAVRKMHIRRADVREEKIVLHFVSWMAAEGYSGWHTSEQIWESFKTFAWEQRFEELSRGALLSAVAVEPGVIKRRAYVQKNDTYEHLRPALKGQERAVVYRMPTEAELAAARHKRTLKDADGCQRPRVPKVRLDPGRQQHPRSAPAGETELKNKDLGLPVDAFDVAA